MLYIVLNYNGKEECMAYFMALPSILQTQKQICILDGRGICKLLRKYDLNSTNFKPFSDMSKSKGEREPPSPHKRKANERLQNFILIQLPVLAAHLSLSQ